MTYTTKFTLNSAHITEEEKGLHGHTWICKINVKGETDKDKFNCKIINKLKEQLDHKVILQINEINKNFVYNITKLCGSENLFLMHNDPTTEELCRLILMTLQIENNKLKYKVELNVVEAESNNFVGIE